MTEPMSDERLIELKTLSSNDQVPGASLAEACREIRKLQKIVAEGEKEQLGIYDDVVIPMEKTIEGYESAMRTIDIVFDGPPSHIGPCFVEIEEGGKGIKLGEWVEIRDGYWAIRFRARLEKP